MVFDMEIREVANDSQLSPYRCEVSRGLYARSCFLYEGDLHEFRKILNVSLYSREPNRFNGVIMLFIWKNISSPFVVYGQA